MTDPDKFGFSNPSLTRELRQDLFNGHAAGVRVPVGAVGRDQVVRWVDGGLDACGTRFLREKKKNKKKLIATGKYEQGNSEANLGTSTD